MSAPQNPAPILLSAEGELQQNLRPVLNGENILIQESPYLLSKQE
jgi:hypothetical protein